jgi:hypothetical protein
MPRNKVVDIKGDVAVSVYDLPVDEIQLALPRPQDEDIPPLAKKKPRLEEPFPTTADEATTENTSHGTTAALPREAADDADSDHVMDTQPNDGATRSTGRWTPEEDVKLTSAITNTCKKKWGKKDRIDWAAVAALVPTRTGKQCWSRWHAALDPKIDQTDGRSGAWTADEDAKLQGALQLHGGKDWIAITALVPGRTKMQYTGRWNDSLKYSIDKAYGP